jgi:hypothetical protein
MMDASKFYVMQTSVKTLWVCEDCGPVFESCHDAVEIGWVEELASEQESD